MGPRACHCVTLVFVLLANSQKVRGVHASCTTQSTEDCEGDALLLLQRGARVEDRRDSEAGSHELNYLSVASAPQALLEVAARTQHAHEHVVHEAAPVNVRNATVTFFKDANCKAPEGNNVTLPLDKDLCVLEWNFTCDCRNHSQVLIASTYYPSCEHQEESYFQTIAFEQCVVGSMFGSPEGLYGKISNPEVCPSCNGERACALFGDGRIHAFDEAMESTQLPAQERAEGDVWVVKSNRMWIQARYRKVPGDKNRSAERPSLTALAIGGPFLDGNRMIIRARDAEVLWGHQNGKMQEILSEASPTFRVLGLLTARSHNHTKQVGNPGEPAFGIDMQLPDKVQMVVNRHWKHLDASISMQDSIASQMGGMDGHCGNFNGDSRDDAPSFIQARAGSSIRKDQLLFNSL
eukprot:CAMPEP_0178436532 /NCGR_PEP_ID=MMETSP0689_2-20121128/34488_1 /TAXON_ID=160604 /ORGANISM="Amphidinium massartii, Strain CS-259" /LENGTH=406 /DNA_ID=CAMNT_0020058631 /DNA_START=113 /DNA_END=1333 /DNA_ORIENTATION=-